MSDTQRGLLPALVTLVLLGGLAADTLSRPRPKDAEPFHARVKAAQSLIPMRFGQWQGTDEEMPAAAIAMLRPNVRLQRSYENKATNVVVKFLVVQCRDARDMGSHYPPVCYPGQGFTMVSSEPADWVVNGEVISGREYTFRRIEHGQNLSRVVCSLLILPDGTYLRDIGGVRAAAADYLRQFYGAAQIQLVADGDLRAEDRRAAFTEILGANLQFLHALGSGGSP